MSILLVALGAGLGIIVLLSLNEGIRKACDKRSQIEIPRVIWRRVRRRKRARMKAQK